MTSQPQARSGPAYKVLAAELRDAIASGKFPTGQPLPTEVELAAEHGLSRQTVRHAFSELVSESLVYRVRGRGTFATPRTAKGGHLQSYDSIEDILVLADDSEMEVIQPLELRTDVAAAGRLRLPSDEVVALVVRRLRKDAPFCVAAIHFPADVGQVLDSCAFLHERGSRTPNEPIIDLLDRSSFGPMMGLNQSITAVASPPDIAPLLDCNPGDTLLRIDRLYFNRAGQRIELAIDHFRPDRYSYRCELRRAIR